LCAQMSDKYDATKKRGEDGKQGMALKVVRTVHQLGGRFLKRSSTGTGWDVVSEEASNTAKVSHCIRDAVLRNRQQRENALTGV
jgi:hypothetical protein